MTAVVRQTFYVFFYESYMQYSVNTQIPGRTESIR